MKLHQKLNAIQTTLIAKKGQFNNFGKYAYRNTEDILEAVKPLLEKNECVLRLTDEVVMVGNRIYIKATAIISDGEDNISTVAFARESESKKGMDESQITGTASSYARKYALNGLLAIDDTKDADTMDNRHKKANEVNTEEEGYTTASKATPEQKKAYWNEFKDICQVQEIDPMEFLESQIDITDKSKMHNTVVHWLRQQDLLRDQLISFKQR